MNTEEYSKRALVNATYGVGNAILYPTLGLAGEAGEVSEKVKKVLRDKSGVFGDEEKHDIALELGDVLWYINAVANDIGYTLEEIMLLNITKIESRRLRNVIKGSGDNR